MMQSAKPQVIARLVSLAYFRGATWTDVEIVFGKIREEGIVTVHYQTP